MTEKVKWIYFAVILVGSVFCYAYFMLYWGNVSLPIIEYIKPNNKFITSALLILLNAFGIGIFGFILALPINYLFGHKGYIASFAAAAAIVVWNVVTWVMYMPEMPYFITIIEWLSIIIVLPLVSVICLKIQNIGKLQKSA